MITPAEKGQDHPFERHHLDYLRAVNAEAYASAVEVNRRLGYDPDAHSARLPRPPSIEEAVAKATQA